MELDEKLKYTLFVYALSARCTLTWGTAYNSTLRPELESHWSQGESQTCVLLPSLSKTADKDDSTSYEWDCLSNLAMSLLLTPFLLWT